MDKKITIDLNDRDNALQQILELMDTNRWDAAKKCIEAFDKLHPDDAYTKVMQTIGSLFDSNQINQDVVQTQKKSITRQESITIFDKLCLKLIKSDSVIHDKYTKEDKAKVIKHMCMLWHQMGVSLAQQDRHSEACQLFKKVISYLPDYLLAQKSLVASLMNLDKYPEAKKILLKLYKEHPKDDSICMYLGNIYHKLKKHTKANEYFTKAVHLNPKKPLHCKNMATICFDQHGSRISANSRSGYKFYIG